MCSTTLLTCGQACRETSVLTCAGYKYFLPISTKLGLPIRTAHRSTPRIVTQVHCFSTVCKVLCFRYKPILTLHNTIVILLLALSLSVRYTHSLAMAIACVWFNIPSLVPWNRASAWTSSLIPGASKVCPRFVSVVFTIGVINVINLVMFVRDGMLLCATLTWPNWLQT